MRRLYILYDSRCGICSRLRTWMLQQPALLELDFVPAGMTRARRLFPELRHDEQPSELVVVTDEGDVYSDEAAWLMCLWALREYRTWSWRLARGPLRPFARAAWDFFSSNRTKLAEMLSLRSDADVARELEKNVPPACDLS